MFKMNEHLKRMTLMRGPPSDPRQGKILMRIHYAFIAHGYSAYVPKHGVVMMKVSAK
jgi:hypothetical protein